MPIRKEFDSIPKRIVVKVGSQAITHPTGGENIAEITKLADDILKLKKQNIEVILVSSGAIQSGLKYLPKLSKSTDLATSQALASIGQIQLIKSYQNIFEQHGIHCGQVLLTHEDFKSKTRYLNAKNTIHILLTHQALPILNENDSVSFQEIALGDNDQLAVMVAKMMDADALILLTGPDGLYDRNPEDPQAIKIKNVPYTQRGPKVKIQAKSGAGKGGMKTKLQAVKKLTPLGIPVIIASYKNPAPISHALFDNDGGTFFEPNPKHIHNHANAWLLSTVKNGSYINVDEGAYNAILSGASVLPKGITSVRGEFGRGDCIGVKFARKYFAVGLSQYNSKEIGQIMGKHNNDISAIIGKLPSKVAIHRNHLVIKDRP